jgi:RHS repeat-associated protein
MGNKQFMRNLVMVSCLVLFLGAGSVHAATAGRSVRKAGTLAWQAPTAVLPGQSATLLPDGNWLLLGGAAEDGPPSPAASIRNSATGNSVPLAAQLQFARAWHSATVLPDGSVLVLGGLGADGKVVTTAELFHPETQKFELVAGAPTSRTSHTATLLTDGRLLIAGGVAPDGRLLNSLELWDFRAKLSSQAGSGLSAARRDHAAFLLPDGRVLFEGGKDDKGNAVTTREIYDPQSSTTAIAPEATDLLRATAGMAEVRANSPEDGALNVAVDALISLRFSRVVSMPSIGPTTVLLSGPDGSVDARVVAAESGMLAFLIPTSALAPGSVYTVQVSGVVDTNNSSVAFSQFSFTTAGQAMQPPAQPPVSQTQSTKTSVDLRTLPPLQAAQGDTALAGRVLRVDGEPLRHVTLQIDSQKAFSDETGRFLLIGLTAGHHAMRILGNTADTETHKYGLFEVGVDIKAARTNVLNYTVWMTPLDTAHAVRIPSPTKADTIIRTPLLPGLELHIPANTVITGYDGKVITEISITPVRLDRPPFPLPHVQVPIYFTIQPGSAYIKVWNKAGPQGAQLYYPNSYNKKPGTVFNFWNYDPDQKGWYVYGAGKVSADGSQIVPNPGVLLYEFTGAMVANQPQWAPPNSPQPGPNPQDGDPVDLSTGLFVYRKTDLALPDVIPVRLTRVYRPNDSISRAFGIGTTHSYDIFIIGDNITYSFIDLILPDGGDVHFIRTSPGTSFGGAVFTAVPTPSVFYGAVINWNGSSWTLTSKDGSTIQFPESFGATVPQQAAMTSITDRNGNQVSLSRDASGNLKQITSPNGRWITFTYDGSNRVTQGQDNVGRTVGYVYDTGGRLQKVTDVNGGMTQFAYDSNNNMTSITDPKSVVYIQNQYDTNSRVTQQTMADGSISNFYYTLDFNSSRVVETQVIDPNENQRVVTFNGTGYAIRDTRAATTAVEASTTFVRDPGTNLVTSITDPLSRTTTLIYDTLGNVASVTQLAGTSNAITISATYDPVFSQPLTITDPLGRTTQLRYDSVGNLTSVIDPLQRRTSLTYTASGQLNSATDPLGNTTKWSYSGGDLVGVTNPLGNRVTAFLDAAGQVASVTLPSGQTWRYSYNGFGQTTQVLDPLGHSTSALYDANGNMLFVRDANGNTTRYTYDSMDREATQTDALGGITALQFDANGNTTQISDPVGNITTIGYDALNRASVVTFGDGSTANYSYDPGNRVVQVVDSLSGTISRTYDALDDLSSEVTPQGSINYKYDTLGRRTEMQVAGQQTVSYTYDNADRLTALAQNMLSVGITYDDDNRRTALTLPNGISIQYNYDSGSRLTSMIYQLGSSTLGDLNYVYDAANRRAQVSGSFARTGLPQTVNSASYDNTNRLTQWNGISLSYDKNGSLINDGVNNYMWNARNQMQSIGGAAFQYDAVGRRSQNGTGTKFLYDGHNIVQELSGTTPVANFVTGGLDEVFNQVTAMGAFTPLTDAAGSTMALADASGTMPTQYTYDPFGNTTLSGAPNSNTFEFTGQQNEENGLYYYRARYYSPLFQRFISRDPISFQAGMNLYSYVGNSPQNYKDPFGLYGVGVVAGGTIAAGSGIGGAGVAGGLQFGMFSGNGSEPAIFGLLGNFGAFYKDPNMPNSPLDFAYPPNTEPNPFFVGLDLGGGVGPFITNADIPNDLTGPFQNYFFDAPWGEVVFEFGLNDSNQLIWALQWAKSPGYGVGRFPSDTRKWWDSQLPPGPQPSRSSHGLQQLGNIPGFGSR